MFAELMFSISVAISVTLIIFIVIDILKYNKMGLFIQLFVSLIVAILLFISLIYLPLSYKNKINHLVELCIDNNITLTNEYEKEIERTLEKRGIFKKEIEKYIEFTKRSKDDN